MLVFVFGVARVCLQIRTPQIEECPATATVQWPEMFRECAIYSQTCIPDSKKHMLPWARTESLRAPAGQAPKKLEHGMDGVYAGVEVC